MKQPLAFRIRPNTLDEIIGQKHLVAKNEILDRIVLSKTLRSMIFFGPPGTGKTTLATVLAKELNLPHRFFNAVTNNKKDLESHFTEAKLSGSLVLIVDEVHRLNKDKQDLLLPHIEDGSIILIGATTANPYFSINPAIRSRVHLFELHALTKENICDALKRALVHPNGLNNEYTCSDADLMLIANASGGDIRFALNTLELICLASDGVITKELIQHYVTHSNTTIDADEDGHYDTLSGFQKSIRGSDVDAALYYLSRLAIANDMESIERRLLVIAYEDIGLANPAACARTIQAIDTAKRVGFPEALIPLGLQVIDLALSPKSKTACLAIHSAYDYANKYPFAPPKYIRLKPHGLKDEEKYDYDRSDLWAKIQYLPNEIKDASFYHPSSSSQYETQLMKNYQQLKKITRTNQLVKLKSNTL
ncbi:MAG: replication-associated recombination protein A [Erysipelotrichaceae bacterium]